MKNENKMEIASSMDLQNGFLHDDGKIYACLFCSAKYEEGEVYAFGKRLVDAGKAVKLHIEEKHGTVFENLLASDRAKAALTETQREFLANYHSGMGDGEIAEKMTISASTVRYQRHSFREKAKQAKLVLALYNLVEQKEKEKAALPAKTPSESEKMLEALFDSVSPLVLKTFDFKKNREKKRLFILETITKQFEKGIRYTEKEVNASLKAIYPDFATIRRSLVDCGFMERTGDCREYWVK